jgi:hypothetical protein
MGAFTPERQGQAIECTLPIFRLQVIKLILHNFKTNRTNYAMESHYRPPRFFFWLLLAIFSTFFAEVTVGSAPLVFFKPDGWLLTVPVYGLHILVLSPLIIRPGRIPAWQSIYLMGTIVGLYEAYMTKILWSPTWNPTSISLGGVAIAETLLLVFFWHPVMAFLVPLVFTERFLELHPILLPALGDGWIKRLSSRRFYSLTGILAGLMLGTILGDPSVVLLATAGTSGLIFLLLLLWKKYSNRGSTGWHDLLSSGRSWKIFAILLLMDFILLGLLIRREAIPGLASQFTVWMMYAIQGWLTWQAIKAQSAADSVENGKPSDQVVVSPTPLLLWTLFAVPFCLVALIAAFTLSPFKNYAFLAVSVLGIPIGLVFFVKSIRWIFSRRSL